MNHENIIKESDPTGVYYTRTVVSSDGALVSAERVKRDPIFTVEQPPVLSLGGAPTVSVELRFKLHDYDGAARLDSGPVHFRLRERDFLDAEGVMLRRELIGGEASLVFEFDAPGEFALTIEPPLPADMQLLEAVRIRVVV